jgi:Domain of unknown function (DUF5666)
MNKISSFFRFVVTITTLLLSACGGAVATSTPEAQVQKAEPMSVAFIGMVDSIAGDQWVINGQTVTVAADAIKDGPFNVGDQVKVEGLVNADGSFTVARVEVPSPQDMTSLPSFGDDNSNAGAENENVSNENANNENSATENTSNENSANENTSNENSSKENESIENGSNENESNENISNENLSNENESNGNSGGSENGNNENDGGENEGNGNGNND